MAGTTRRPAAYSAVVSLASVPRRRLVLGAAGAATYGALAWWSIEYRIRRAEVPLYSETVAFLSPGWRELVPAGHTDTLVPGTRVLAGRPLSTALVEDEQAWLEACSPWVATTLDGGDDVLRSALLDLRALSVGLAVSVAGWSERWRYAWPRDVSFVATALARIGHPEHAARQLTYLQEVQRRDGVFEARYDPATGRTPDERVAQLDGSAWVVWGAHQLALAAPDRAVELLTPLSSMLVRSATRLMAVIDPRTGLPKASSDYWELVEPSVTLGTAASVLAGLRSATEVLPLVGEPLLAEQTRAAAESLSAAVHGQFGAAGVPAPARRPRGRRRGHLPRRADRPSRRRRRGPQRDGPGAGRDGAAGRRGGAGRGVEGRRHQLDTGDRAVRRCLGRERPAGARRVAARLARRPPHRRGVVPGEGALRRSTGRCGATGVDGGAGGHRPPRAGARVRRLALLVASSLAAVLGVLGLVSGEATASAAEDTASPRLVVVGAPGLAWSDLEGADLPALDAMTAQGAVGSLTVRSVRSRACAVDGWLTLSAGRRAGDVAGPCREPLPVVDDRVPRWDEYLAAADAGSYDAHPGTLGEGVTASGACVETVGAGAAIGGAGPSGEVRTHQPRLPASFSCPVVLVDGGTLPESVPGAPRRSPGSTPSWPRCGRWTPAPTSSWPASATASRPCGPGRWWRQVRRTGVGS